MTGPDRNRQWFAAVLALMLWSSLISGGRIPSLIQQQADWISALYGDAPAQTVWIAFWRNGLAENTLHILKY